MNKRYKLIFCLVLVIIFFSFYSKIVVQAKTYKYSSKAVNVVLVKSTDQSSVLTNKTSFKTYKVITMDKLNIRKGPTVTSNKVGIYEAKKIVDVIGTSGTFLKTSQGYIAGVYTKIITGMYLTVAKDTNIINSSTNNIDDRILISGKYYLITGFKNNMILVNIGRISGYIKQDSIASLSDTNKSKVTIGWEYVNKQASNVKNIEDMSSYVNTKSSKLGLDILSPTWFDASGNVKDPTTIQVNNIADKNYVTIAHKNGYEVWPRLCETDKNRAAIEFNNLDVRSRLISQIAKLALDYDIDGINVDYEALGANNKDGFTDFVKEIYSKLKGLNLKISVDVTRYSTSSSLYSLCYDRPNLSKYCNYLVLMGYDEHVSSSQEPGSVGSYSWVDESIRQILNQGVPKNKLILGVPFYLRDFGVISNDAIIFNKPGKIYTLPIEVDNNKLADSSQGTVFKIISSDESWYQIDYNGVKGYINKKDALFVKADALPVTTDSSIIVTTNGGIDSTTDEAINSTTTGGAIITPPYDTIVANDNIIIYKNEYEITTNKLGDANTKDYYKYIATQGDWYIIEYKGVTGYVPKAAVSFLKADSRAINSSAVSMQAAQDLINQYGGSIINDPKAKQSVGIYYKDGFKHLIWLETKDSMSWRMDLANSYGLPGAAVWSLYWKPTVGIWDIIKKKLK
jgi:spore germination protein YaaH